MSSIKLTIITACFNSASTIQQTFKSVLNQALMPYEYIVVDGNSTDETVEIIKVWETKFRLAGVQFKWVSEPDRGIYDAWNKALSMSTGDWISFLGSDDLYLKEALEAYDDCIKSSDGLDFVTAKAKIVEKGKLVRTFGEPFLWSDFRREMRVLHAGGFLNKKYIDQYGKYDTEFKIVGDYEHLLRKGSELKVGFIDKFLVTMGAGGVSDKMVRESLYEARLAKVKNGSRGKLEALLDEKWVLFKIQVKRKLLNG